MDAAPLALLSLGALHGINPGMGWLFAVALGLQEGKGRAVWRALLPLAAGHALAVAGALLVAFALGIVLPAAALRWIVVLLLVMMAARQFMRARHPRVGGMLVGARDIALWSFLMSSAHGAGLMVVPVLLGSSGDLVPSLHAHHAVGHEGASAAMAMSPFMATAIHTAGYLAVTGLVAVVVYEKLGLRLLRKFWINLDVVWAVALVVTAGWIVLA